MQRLSEACVSKGLSHSPAVWIVRVQRTLALWSVRVQRTVLLSCYLKRACPKDSCSLKRACPKDSLTLPQTRHEWATLWLPGGPSTKRHWCATLAWLTYTLLTPRVPWAPETALVQLVSRTLTARPKLQALVYDILPSTTAVFSYAIGSRKLSANEQFFVGAQTVVGLLQTTRIKQGVSFIAANKVYTSTNKTTIVWIETELFSFLYPGWMRLMLTCVLWR